MAYIYRIVNDINNKSYIGKTTLSSIEKRFQQHLNESSYSRSKNRPLYKAINKYGKEHFYIELVEECPLEILSEREIYWIEFYKTFKEGYNATLGGDGKPYVDYDLIYSLWNRQYNIKQIHEITQYDKNTISRVLTNKNVTERERKKRGIRSVSHSVAMLDIKTSQIIQIFNSIAEACRFLNKQHSGHIADVCKGKRKTAYGYRWEYI